MPFFIHAEYGRIIKTEHVGGILTAEIRDKEAAERAKNIEGTKRAQR